MPISSSDAQADGEFACVTRSAQSRSNWSQTRNGAHRVIIHVASTFFATNHDSISGRWTSVVDVLDEMAERHDVPDRSSWAGPSAVRGLSCRDPMIATHRLLIVIARL